MDAVRTSTTSQNAGASRRGDIAGRSGLRELKLLEQRIREFTYPSLKTLIQVG